MVVGATQGLRLGPRLGQRHLHRHDLGGAGRRRAVGVRPGDDRPRGVEGRDRAGVAVDVDAGGVGIGPARQDRIRAEVRARAGVGLELERQGQGRGRLDVVDVRPHQGGLTGSRRVCVDRRVGQSRPLGGARTGDVGHPDRQHVRERRVVLGGGGGVGRGQVDRRRVSVEDHGTGRLGETGRRVSPRPGDRRGDRGQDGEEADGDQPQPVPGSVARHAVHRSPTRRGTGGPAHLARTDTTPCPYPTRGSPHRQVGSGPGGHPSRAGPSS